MQTKRNAELVQKDLFSKVPEEVILLILQYLSDKDLGKNIVNISRKFNDIVHRHFLNSAYGQAFRFNKWYQTNISIFKNDADNAKSNQRSTLLTEPDPTQPANRRFSRRNITFILGMLFFMGFIYKLEAPGDIAILKYLALALKIIVVLTFVAAIVALQLISTLRSDNSLQRTITNEDLSIVQSGKNKLLFANHENLIQPGTTLRQFQWLINDCITTHEEVSKKFDSYFQGLRFESRRRNGLGNIDYENLNKTYPGLGEHIKKLVTFWLRERDKLAVENGKDEVNTTPSRPKLD